MSPVNGSTRRRQRLNNGGGMLSELAQLSSAQLAAYVAQIQRLTAPFEIEELMATIVDAGQVLFEADAALWWDLALGQPPALRLPVLAETPRSVAVPADNTVVGTGLLSDGAWHQAANAVGRRLGLAESSKILCIPFRPEDDCPPASLHLLRPEQEFRAAELTLARLFAEQCQEALHRAHMTRDRIAQRVLADELAVARDIQLSILPATMPEVPGYQLCGLLRPTEQTGGDMFDLVELEQGLFILLGDATGHGFGPALSATQMQAMLRVAFRLGASLDDAYRHVNNQLDEDLPDDRFVTAFMGFLDHATHTVRYHSAGQGPILYYSARSRHCHWYGPTTFPLGTLPVAESGSASSLQMAPGDVLAVLSDGVYEYEDATGIFGHDRVAQLVMAGAGGSMMALGEQLLASLLEFGGDQPQNDDVTIVLVKREQVGER